MLQDIVQNIRKSRFTGQDWSSSLGIAIILGFVAIVYNSLFATTDSNLSASLFLGGASLLIGIFLGFLFGIPRSLQSSGVIEEREASEDQDKTAGATAPSGLSVRYQANTNLEQISDWLTKILVGVGLTQIGQIPELFSSIGGYFGVAAGSGELGSRLAVVIVLYFLVSGFLFGYLWTRLFLGGELAKADLNAVSERVQKFEQAQEVQSQIDARAISLVSQYLSANDVSKVPVEALKAAVEKASAPVKVQIFYQAQAIRSESWQMADRKYLLERTIPIFEALAVSDIEKRFHKNFGQLGFALKDKRDPDYAAAEAALSEAIRIRGPAEDAGWQLYEFNRAICRIKQDEAFATGKPSAPELARAIKADIEVAQSVIPDLHDDPTIMEWLALNPD